MSEQRHMRLRGDGVNVNRYRGNKENTRVSHYLDVLGEYTVADLLGVIAELLARPEDVTFSGGCFRISLPATPEDVARWEQYDADQIETARIRRREWYERLRAEFDDTPPTPDQPAQGASDDTTER